ncbi:disulfide bond formation protein DsbA [Rhizobium sullae]|uniref:Disulfide bond formation protein DsbA n=1 Tax=Rhizobium sullae TaxID=50338 RepID=A0A2N0D1M6_RHISU|nr:DsbA family oxidoreductase [Rhizobium sullae]PKA39996.1 disulfide bond formation protein DsbA [Rhizobium sullae]
MTITIKISSDFICPWCLIGERRLGKAIAGLPAGADVAFEWQPFELNPDMPSEGMDRKVYRSLKFGSWERSQLLDAHTVEAARDDDVAFDYAAIQRTPNTLAAHRLMRFAAEHKRATQLAEAIFSAYFEKGRDIGDAGILGDIATEIGLDRAQALSFLTGEEGAGEVREQENAVLAIGVRSVPTFDIAGEVISGAQPTVVFQAALRRASMRKPIEADADCSTSACSIA